MKYYLLTFLVFIGFSACSEPKKHYDGGALLYDKCASCHDLKMPPKTYEDEKAPPMMAVAFHVKDFMKVDSPSEKKPKFIDFFQDYVLHPAAEKSFCDKESLASYGVMPSQKGNVSREEVAAIAEYVYDFYDQNKFLKQMREKSAFDAMPKGKQIATHKGCFTCHSIKKSKAAPSFSAIAKKPESEISQVIQNGSKGTWKGFERMTMPAYKSKLNDQESKILTDWIKSL